MIGSGSTLGYRSRGLRKTRDKHFGFELGSSTGPCSATCLMGCSIRDSTVADVQLQTSKNQLLDQLVAQLLLVQNCPTTNPGVTAAVWVCSGAVAALNRLGITMRGGTSTSQRFCRWPTIHVYQPSIPLKGSILLQAPISFSATQNR